MLTFKAEAAELCQLVDNCEHVWRSSQNKPESRAILEHLTAKIAQKHATLTSLISAMRATQVKA